MTSYGVVAYEKRSVEEFGYWREGNFDNIHAPLMEYLKPGQHALDIGSGLGRDSLALAKHGLSVTSAEPWSDALEAAKSNIREAQISWVSAHLPSLILPDDVPKVFDVVLLSAVWMHIPRKFRMLAMRRLSQLMASDAKMAISIRRPIDESKGQFEATGVEARLLASGFDLECLYDCRHDDPFESRRGSIFWDYLIFRKSST